MVSKRYIAAMVAAVAVYSASLAYAASGEQKGAAVMNQTKAQAQVQSCTEARVSTEVQNQGEVIQLQQQTQAQTQTKMQAQVKTSVKNASMVMSDYAGSR